MTTEARGGWLMAYHAAGRTWLDSDGMHLAHSVDVYDD